MSNKILVLRLSSLGDVILTAPALRSLKAHWPDCRISVLVKPQFAGALEGNPNVEEIIPFRGLSQALSRIRAGGFTHLLDLHSNLRSFLIRSLSGIPKISVYRKHALSRRLFVAFGLRSPALEKHTVERYLEALAPWGAPARQASVSLEDYGAGGRKGPQEGPSRILIIQSAFLGDSLLTLPLARQIKQLLPACRLSVLTKEATASLFRDSHWVDSVLVDDKDGEHGGLLGPWRLAAGLRGQGFDLALIPHRSLRSALLAWLAKIPRRVGFSASAGRLLLTQEVPFTWLMHDLERNLSLLKALQPSLRLGPEESLYVGPDQGLSLEVSERLRESGVGPEELLVGVHPGSAWATKRWLPGRFAEVCRRLALKGFRVVLIGGREDLRLCAEIARESRALDWSGRTGLRELRALMGRLSLFITNDSGPMHLAAACGVPTLAIFGPTTRELGFFPYGPSHRVLEADLPCRPCGLHGARACPRGHFLCMRLITAEQAWKTVEEMLSNCSGSSTPPPPVGRGDIGPLNSYSPPRGGGESR